MKEKVINKKSNNNENMHKKDGIVTLVASLVVLFSSLIDPIVSLVVSIVFLVAYSIFKIFFDKRK